MKKILIVSYMFAPRAGIGSIRWTKLAKYLEAHDIISDVLTLELTSDQDDTLAQDAAGLGGMIHRVAHSERFGQKGGAKTSAPSGPVAARADGLLGTVKRSRLVVDLRRRMGQKNVYKAQWNNYAQGEDFCAQSIKYIAENNIRPDEYDAVVVSFGPVGCALLALEIKRLYPGTRLFMDFRDPMVNFLQSGEMNRHYSELQRRVCLAADRVLTVSHGCAEKIAAGDESIKAKMCIITNGYDVADIAGLSKAEQPDSEFSFAFTGSLYDGLMDMSPLIRTLAQLVRDGIVRKEHIRIKYAGSNFYALVAQAQRYGMGDVLVDCGYLQRRDTLRLQMDTRFLVFCTWNRRDSRGIVTGKMLEYMMMDRPIIGLVSGKLAQSESRCIIEELNAGIVYEQADRGSHRALYEYLKADYQRFCQGLASEHEPDLEKMGKYDYRSIAGQLAGLI